jgi:hypothetical protein
VRTPQHPVAVEPFEVAPCCHCGAIAVRADLFYGHDAVLVEQGEDDSVSLRWEHPCSLLIVSDCRSMRLRGQHPV